MLKQVKSDFQEPVYYIYLQLLICFLMILTLREMYLFLRLHAVFRMKQGRQRKLVLRFSALHFSPKSEDTASTSAELNALLLRRQSEEAKILNISFPRAEIEPTTYRAHSHTLVPLPHDWPGHKCILKIYLKQT